MSQTAMNDVPSPKQYKQAFARFLSKMTDQQCEMLRVHYSSPRHMSTPRQLAQKMKWKNRGAAHLHYGKLAGTLCHLLKRSPQYKVEVLCSFKSNRHTGETLWVMHHNVTTALKELGWIRKHPRFLAEGLLSPRDLSRVRAYIAAFNWKFAKTMPQWPHSYVVRDWRRKREFDFFAKLIEKNGYIDPWGRHRWKYLVVDNFKYWVDDDVLNRAQPKSNAWFIKRGNKHMARHGRRRAWHPG